MRKSFENMAIRGENARQRLIDALSRQGEISSVDAGHVATLYLKEKIAKLDHVGGQFQIKHGAFMEKDVIRRAADMAYYNMP